MEKYIWVGHRESEIFKTNCFFSLSITSWGSNKNGNIAYCKKFNTRDIDNEIKRNFIIDKLKELLLNKNYKVMFYSPTLAYSLLKLWRQSRILCKVSCLNLQDGI